MMVRVFFIFSGQDLKLMMQLAKTTFLDFAIFIEKRTVEYRLLAKSEFLWAKKCIILPQLAGGVLDKAISL